MATSEGALLSILAWPDGATRDDRIEALVASAGIEPYDARLAAAKDAPCIVGLIDEATAGHVTGALAGYGVTCFAPTAATIRSIPPTLFARRIERQTGGSGQGFKIETWSNQRASISGRDIYLIVRAKLRKRGLGPERTEVDINYYGAAAGPGPGMVTVSEHSKRDPRTSIRDILEVYDRRGARFRVDGSKFNFDVLGEMRGHSDNENADRVALMVAGTNPDALVDMAFTEFSCGPQLAKRFLEPLTGPDRMRFELDPTFELYSKWCFLMHKAMTT